ncbi:MAG: hypothetical protein IID45_02840 [Planctomycetes bacterium]|nr:hypothetical protein [Planctomycetota bacterium]
MRQQVGIALQFLVLIFLPALLFFDLDFGIKRLVIVPLSLATASAVFWVGHKLRES